MGNETQKNEFSYAENDSATPCCKINQQNVQFLHWVVTSFNFKYFVPKFKTVFINYSPQTSFVNNVLQICLIMLNVIIYRGHYFYFTVSHRCWCWEKTMEIKDYLLWNCEVKINKGWNFQKLAEVIETLRHRDII